MPRNNRPLIQDTVMLVTISSDLKQRFQEKSAYYGLSKAIRELIIKDLEDAEDSGNVKGMGDEQNLRLREKRRGAVPVKA
ncbi:hypothetical protein ES703_36325 [subsurface metagenome]